VDIVAVTDTGRRSARPASCRICGGSTHTLGNVHGAYSGRDYELRRCEHCRFAFIANPWTEFERIYDDRYYAGAGADPLVDYQFELAHPKQTVRQYEWRGILDVVQRLVGGLDGKRWLDFGCGNGGLVRFVQEQSEAQAVGFDDGAMAGQAHKLGIPVLAPEELLAQDGSFDVVTAIEVLEHTIDPIAELRQIRRLLRPGGLLFLTTGNAAAFAEHLTDWSYIVPEIHISFFEPSTLTYALEQSGFRPEQAVPIDGFDQIIKFKVLKNLRIRRRSLLTDFIPARMVALAADRRVRLREHPVGWACEETTLTARESAPGASARAAPPSARS
jgi:2-polyprenyl-3-methyl-5-hydroxy-6-metoxy-1,4-benzoquinol methylase